MTSGTINRRTRVAVFAPLYPPAYRGGGPIRSIEALVEAAPKDTEPLVFTSDTDLGQPTRMAVPSNTWTTSRGSRVYFVTSTSIRHVLSGLVKLRRERPDVLHLNSFFNLKFSIVPVVLSRLGFWRGAGIIISPRGEFGEAAIGRRALKKRIYMRAFRILRMHGRTIWHSTADHETVDIKAAWGAESRVVQRQNATLLPAVASIPDRALTSTVKAIFLGRIVEHKGLHVVLSALKGVTGSITLDVFGSAEDPDYHSRCESLATELPHNVTVKFNEGIPHEDVRSVLADHEVLLMPTAGENFGHVIAEAMSVSCLVVATPYTPWTDVIRAGGGIVSSDRTVSNWTASIQSICELQVDDRTRRIAESSRAYDKWRAADGGPQVWDLALDALGRKDEPTLTKDTEQDQPC